MSNQTTFWKNFQAKQFTDAERAFDQLSSEDKQAVLSQLFQQSQVRQQPHSVSVLFRKLHDGSTFEDFYQAWFPPKEKCDPIEDGGQTYQQFFPVPIRVINAVNIHDPSDVVSIGMHWMTDEQLDNALRDPKVQEDGEERGDKISEVAQKTAAGIYKVVADDNLGVAF